MPQAFGIFAVPKDGALPTLVAVWPTREKAVESRGYYGGPCDFDFVVMPVPYGTVVECSYVLSSTAERLREEIHRQLLRAALTDIEVEQIPAPAVADPGRGVVGEDA